MDFKIDENKLQQGVTDEVIQHFVDEVKILDVIAEKINTKIDTIFAEKIEDLISKTINDSIKEGLRKEYQAVDCFGMPIGEKTTIQKN